MQGIVSRELNCASRNVHDAVCSCCAVEDISEYSGLIMSPNSCVGH